MPKYFQNICYEYFILGLTDLNIEMKTGIAAKSVHRIRQMAIKALTAALTRGSFEEMEKLYEFKPYKEKQRRERIRVWRAEEDSDSARSIG